MGSGGEQDRLIGMEVLSARLLHDLAGSVSAVVSYVDCLGEGSESSDVLKLLEESSEEIIARFRLLRQAYGGAEDNCSFDRTRDNLEKYLKKRGISDLAWEVRVQPSDAELIEKVNRLLTHAVLLSVMMMVRGMRISVLLCDMDCSIQICIGLSAEEVVMHNDVASVLAPEHGNEGDLCLSTHNVQAYFMSLLMVKYGATFCYDTANSAIKIDIPYQV